MKSPKVKAATAILEKTQETLASLITRRDAASRRKGELAEQRQEIAHAALAENDESARVQLETLGAESLAIDLQLENLSAAVAGAKARVVEVEQHVMRTANIVRANEAKAIIVKRVDAAARISKLMAGVGAEFEQYITLGRKLADVTGRHVGAQIGRRAEHSGGSAEQPDFA